MPSPRQRRRECACGGPSGCSTLLAATPFWQVWDLGAQLSELKDEAAPAAGSQGKVHKVNARHVHTHSSEGYALDWSPVAAGRLASGDCRSRIHVWEPTPAGKWAVSSAYR